LSIQRKRTTNPFDLNWIRRTRNNSIQHSWAIANTVCCLPTNTVSVSDAWPVRRQTYTITFPATESPPVTVTGV